LFSSVFSVAFRKVFRVGELVLCNREQAYQIIGFENISFELCNDLKIIKIHITISKTDQYGHSTLTDIIEI